MKTPRHLYDIIIIGGGVVGCCIARELSKLCLKTAVLEKSSDICDGASKANSGIVHAGFDAPAGTLKAKLNLRGCRMMPALSRELDFHYQNNGALVLSLEDNTTRLSDLEKRGLANGVEGLSIISGSEAREKEPSLSPQVRFALYAPTSAIICPFGLTIAMAENAKANGVDFYRDTQVTSMEKRDDVYIMGDFSARMVINAAGVHADYIHSLASQTPLEITPRRGEYLLFDKSTTPLTRHTLFQLPSALGKGVLITPTTHGNVMIGPTAEDIEDKEGTNTTRAGLAAILASARKIIENIPEREVITSFAGLRANANAGDFIIGMPPDAPGFIDVAGIDSPGLSAAPAIAEYVVDIVSEYLPTRENPSFMPTRHGISKGEDEIVCRCEHVSRSEVTEAIRRAESLYANPRVVSLDAVKRRIRPGSGRCGGGFCAPRVAHLIAEELGMEITAVTKDNLGSELLHGSI